MAREFDYETWRDANCAVCARMAGFSWTSFDWREQVLARCPLCAALQLWFDDPAHTRQYDLPDVVPPDLLPWVGIEDDDDTPALPVQFHMAIVWRALQFYGMYESAPEAVARGEREFDKAMARIAIDRLPGVGLAGALA